MFKKLLPVLFIGTALGSGAAWTAAAAAAEKAQASEPICGSSLMTRQERRDYMARMRSAKTDEERESMRTEHHEAMQARAKERGVALPAQGACGAMGQRGMGKGMGMGPGMGPGMGGMGPGPRGGPAGTP